MLDIRLFNQNMELVAIIDNYFSMIWTERYAERGDFSLEMVWGTTIDINIKIDNFIMLPSEISDRIMMIEDLKFNVDKNQGRTIIITGSSFEDILSRRVSDRTTVNDYVEDVISTLLDDAAISPNDPNRKIPNLYVDLSSDPDVTTKTIQAQYPPDNIYNIVVAICATLKLGFKIIVDANRTFRFSLFSGKDRSLAQTDNAIVVFSENFDNLLDDSYFISDDNTKNLTWVIAEQEIPAYRLTEVYNTLTVPTGYLRRETITDGSRMDRLDDDGLPINDTDMGILLTQSGLDDLSTRRTIRLFDGEGDVNGTFKLGTDFFMGDIVQYVGANQSVPARIVEIIKSVTDNGIRVYISFDFNL